MAKQKSGRFVVVNCIDDDDDDDDDDDERQDCGNGIDHVFNIGL